MVGLRPMSLDKARFLQKIKRAHFENWLDHTRINVGVINLHRKLRLCINSQTNVRVRVVYIFYHIKDHLNKIMTTISVFESLVYDD